MGATSRSAAGQDPGGIGGHGGQIGLHLQRAASGGDQQGAGLYRRESAPIDLALGLG
jgi:hypothetical protein